MADGGEYDYDNKRFRPPRVHRTASTDENPGDQRRSSVYVYTEEIKLAVDVALTTGRPVIVRGPSGAGKSSLARSAADVLGWRFYERVITSRTQARDLLYEVDLVRRLHAANQRNDAPPGYEPYIVPGVLWWAFSPETARWRGLDDPAQGNRDADRAVVLLDEIDKADPDVPNNLLVPLGSLSFTVDEMGVPVSASRHRAPLVILTTNDERELPRAFLRRCVEIAIPAPTPRRLLEIAQAHLPDSSEAVATAAQVLEAILGPERASRLDDSVDLSPAEFVDTLRACREHRVGPVGPRKEVFDALSRITVWKQSRQEAP